jgi:hypothetical protein
MPSMCQCNSKITAVEKCGKTLRQSLAGVEGGSRLTLEANRGQWAIIETHFANFVVALSEELNYADSRWLEEAWAFTSSTAKTIAL